jgi:hypothetical protein
MTSQPLTPDTFRRLAWFLMVESFTLGIVIGYWIAP